MNMINTIPFPVCDRSSESLHSQGTNLHIWDYGNSIDRQNEIIIGMSPTNYHCYLIANETEYHPRFSFNKAKLSRPRRRAIRAGVFIRLKGLTQDQVLSFESYLRSLSDKRSRSCHLGVLEALANGAGISIRDNNQMNLNPHQFLTLILKYGFAKDGTNIELEINTIKSLTLNEILNEVQYFQGKFKWAYLISDLYYLILTKLNPNKKISRLS